MVIYKHRLHNMSPESKLAVDIYVTTYALNFLVIQLVIYMYNDDIELFHGNNTPTYIIIIQSQ